MLTTVFRTMLITSMKDKITLFYSLIFPIGLLIGLGLYFDSTDYRMRLLIGVLALGTLFWGVQGIAFQVHQQRGKGVYKLLRLTPFPTMSFILTMTLARTVIGLAINLTVLAVGVVAFGLSVSVYGLLLLQIVLTAGTLCFTCLGFLISNFAKNEGQINMLSNLLQIPMVFGSEAFYSLTNAPGWLVQTGKLFPFKYFVDGLRFAMESNANESLLSLLIVAGFTAIILILSSATFRWDADHTALSDYRFPTLLS